MSRKNIRSIVQFVLLLGVGILLIWLSLRSITAEQKQEIKHAFQTADYFWIVVSMLVAFLSHFLRAYRWNYLLQPVGYKTNLLNATCHVLVGYFANYGIPRMGEVSRCTLAARYDKVPFEVGFGTVITERIIDFMLFLIIFLLTLALQFNELIGLANKLIFDKLRDKLVAMSANPLKITLLLGALALVFLGIYLLRKKFAALLKGKLGGILKGMAQGLGSVRKMDRPLEFIGLSVLIWACYFYSLYLCFFALPGTSHLGQKECLTLLLFGTFGVIFSPGGLGAYPAIVGGILLLTYNIDTVSAFALPWLSWTSQFMLVVVLGIISLIVLPLYNRKKDVVSPSAQK
jgi:uncharacterized protein (TIRG00374 family)